MEVSSVSLKICVSAPELFDADPELPFYIDTDPGVENVKNNYQSNLVCFLNLNIFKDWLKNKVSINFFMYLILFLAHLFLMMPFLNELDSDRDLDP